MGRQGGGGLGRWAWNLVGLGPMSPQHHPLGPSPPPLGCPMAHAGCCQPTVWHAHPSKGGYTCAASIPCGTSMHSPSHHAVWCNLHSFSINPRCPWGPRVGPQGARDQWLGWGTAHVGATPTFVCVEPKISVPNPWTLGDFCSPPQGLQGTPTSVCSPPPPWGRNRGCNAVHRLGQPSTVCTFAPGHGAMHPCHHPMGERQGR